MMGARYGTRDEDAHIFEQSIYEITLKNNPRHIVDICRAMYDECDTEGLMESTFIGIDHYLDICDIDVIATYVVKGIYAASKEGSYFSQVLLGRYINDDKDMYPLARAVQNETSEVQQHIRDMAVSMSTDEDDVEERGKKFLDLLALNTPLD